MAKTAVLALTTFVCVSSSLNATPFTHLSYFRKSGFCLSSTCVRENLEAVQGTMECARKCTKTKTCFGFEYNKTKSSCSLLNKGCFSDFQCAYFDDPNRRVYELNTNKHGCLNNGNYDISTATCRCVGGWVGKTCERRPYNCKELYDFGYSYGIRKVVMDVAKDQSLLPVIRCNIRKMSSSMFILKNSGRTRHHKTWQNFVSGYTIHGADFWMGLENARALTRMGHTEVRFRFALFDEGETLNIRYIYKNFQISDAMTGYSFTSDPGVLLVMGPDYMKNRYTMEDVLTPCAGRPFLTPDNDSSQKCSQQAETGWWFPDCTDGIAVNPLGYRANSASPPQGPMNIHLPGLNMSDESLQNMNLTIALFFRTVH